MQLHNLPFRCIKRYYVELIGKTIRNMLAVKVDLNYTGWGQYLQVRLELNLTKPLGRCRLLNFDGETLWIPIKYKKLPRLFLNCGRIVHEAACKDEKMSADSPQYGTWLRAGLLRRGWLKEANGDSR